MTENKHTETSAMNDYKKTKLGWIPEDWEIGKLSKVIELASGQHLSPTEYNGRDKGVPYFTGPTDFCSDLDSVSKWTQEGKKFAESGDILITVKGSGVGTLYISSLKKVAIGRQLMAIRPKEAVQGFIFNFLLQRKKWLEVLASGNMIPGLSRNDILNLKMPLPPLPEQKKISEILSTWDRAISTLEQFIQAKKRYKKGLMQQLLSLNASGQAPKKRFPELEGEPWVEVRLGNVFKERKETGYSDYDLLAITTENGVVDRDTLDRRDTSSDTKDHYKRILPGDIGYNTMRMWQGVSGYSELKGIVSPAYTIVVPKEEKADSRFMSYLFKHPRVIDLFRRYSQGLVDDTLNLKFKNFAEIKVSIPKNLKEQKKIAQVLLTVDREIELLDMQKETFKKQKKGLMQQLLTGKVRVKEIMEDAHD